jgi:hypothetical protein
MRFDTLNFTLVRLAALLVAVAVFRSHAFNAPTRSKNPIGFSP